MDERYCPGGASFSLFAPGDIILRGERSSFHFPLATGLLLSIVASVVLWLLRALRG